MGASANLFAQTCASPISVSVCPQAALLAQNFGGPGVVDAVASWTGPNGTIPSSGNEIFYAVTVQQQGTEPPISLQLTVNYAQVPIQAYFLGATPGTCTGTYLQSTTFGATDCQEVDSFFISSTGTYYIAIEGTGTFDLRIGGVLGGIIGVTDPKPAIPPFPGVPACLPGDMSLSSSSPTCIYTPFKTINPSFQLCLNGVVQPTGSLLTFNLAPAINQLCIKTNFKNLTGGEGLQLVDFNFGPALTATPTTSTCTGATTITPYSTMPAMMGGVGSWEVSEFINPPITSPPAPNVPLSNRISWQFNNGYDRGDATGCPTGDCKMYEFCFEIVATSNLPLLTKVVGAFYGDYYSAPAIAAHPGSPASPGGDPKFIPYFCGTGERDCFCSEKDCFERNRRRVLDRIGRKEFFIDFEDPAPPVILPINDIHLLVSHTNSQAAALTWTADIQDDLAGFGIERSTNGINFEKIAYINTQINGNKEYQFTDQNPANGITYYRLKLVSKNGSFTYSNIESFSTKNLQIKIAQNPGTGKFKLTGKTIPNQSATLYTSIGKAIAVSIKNNEVNIASQPAGIYFLKINSENVSLRLLKQ